MGSDVTKAYGAEKRTDMLMFDPDKLVIVDDPTHPLHDPYRIVEKPAEAFILNIVALGVKEPVLVRLNGRRKDGSPVVEVIDGRQRVMAARAANKILKKRGEEPLRVRAITEKGDDATMLATMIALNEHRKADSLLAKAKKLQRYMSLGRDLEEGAMHFGVSVTAARQWLTLLDCDDEIQSAVQAGTIAGSTAMKLAALPRSDQKKALADMIASGATKGASAEAAVRRAQAGEPEETLGAHQGEGGDKHEGGGEKAPRPRRANDGDSMELVPSKPSLKKLATRIEESIAEGKWSEKNALIAKTIAQTIAFVTSGEKLPGVAANVYEKVAEEVRAKRQAAAKRAFEKRAQAATESAEKADDEADIIRGLLSDPSEDGPEESDIEESDIEEPEGEEDAETEAERTARAARDAERLADTCSACQGLGFTDHTLKTICKACDGGCTAEAERALDAAIAADVEGSS
jgi:ParB family chromosome partitioning protein